VLFQGFSTTLDACASNVLKLFGMPQTIRILWRLLQLNLACCIGFQYGTNQRSNTGGGFISMHTLLTRTLTGICRGGFTTPASALYRAPRTLTLSLALACTVCGSSTRSNGLLTMVSVSVLPLKRSATGSPCMSPLTSNVAGGSCFAITAPSNTTSTASGTMSVP
jgi:hypothetical protein